MFRKQIPKKIYIPVILAALFFAWVLPVAAISYDLTATRFLLRGYADVPEITAPGNPDANTGRLYVADDTGTTKLYFKDSAGTATDLLSPTVSTAWDDIGAPDANDSISFSTYTMTMTGAQTAADGFNFLNTGNFGDISVVKIQQLTGNPTNGTLLEVTAADTNADGVVISNTTADLDATNTLLTLSLTDDGDADGIFINCLDNAGADSQFKVADNGDTTIAGSLTVGTAIYQSAIVAAASGNQNLTIDAAGNGTITIGGTSTGKIVTDNLVEIDGNIDLGDGAADTVTINGSIDGDVTLDDGSGASPSFIMQDATDETLTVSKLDSGYATFTTAAADGVSIRTGNLTVGNGSAGTAAMDGEDFYCEGESEFDGTMTIDGAANFNGAVSLASTLALSENVTFTMAADEYMQLDAATTDSTTTAGALDINFDSVTNGAEGINVKATIVTGGGGSEVVSGMVVDLDDDSDAAGTLIGVDINASDATGSSSVVGVRLGNALEQGINATNAAATQTLIIDATTAAQTGTAGSVADIAFRTATDTAHAINLDVESDLTGAGEKTQGIKIVMDDDAANADNEIHAINIGTDGDGTGLQHAIVVSGSGIDAALQADHGYVRIGTGSSPGVTPGDDDLYVEGTAEVDGIIYADGGITGDGQADIVGMTSPIEAYTGADNVITIAESGKTFTNTGDGDGSQHTLPEASTCIGCEFTFVVTAAQQMVIELDDADIFLHLTLDAGDQIQSSTVGDSITVRALDATNWAVISVYPTAADWADGGA